MSEALFDLTPSQKRVLEQIWHFGPIARRDIADRVQMTPAAVTGLARDLAARNLVTETVERSGARGQPARPLSINRRGAFSIGVNFSHAFVEAGAVDLKGQMLAHQSVRLSSEDPDPAEISAQVKALIPDLLKKAGAPPERCLGVGFTLPGDFLPDGVRLKAHPYFPRFRDVDIRQALAGDIELDCFFENDALTAAIGEQLLGYGRSVESLMLIHIGHGVGGGLMHKGEAFRGAHGNAALVGVLYPDDQPRPSGMDLFQTLRDAGHEGRIDFPDLQALYQSSDTALQGWIKRAGAQLETAIYVATRLFDPSVVVIGGRLPGAISKAVCEQVNTDRAFGGGEGFAKTAELPAPVLTASQHGSLAGVIGAASLAVKSRLLTTAERG
ncbi:ROK family protein [Oceanicaulis sp. LC35]|uniref:ROK family transcriptional regulator n=1 Tax=Oceanicaulis sp. LC35 TaxID=3349635 RepID=UPI003F8334D2